MQGVWEEVKRKEYERKQRIYNYWIQYRQNPKSTPLIKSCKSLNPGYPDSDKMLQ